jgi:hypothetical protein
MSAESSPHDEYSIEEFVLHRVSDVEDHRLRAELYCRYHASERVEGWEAIHYEVILHNSKEIADLRELSVKEIEALAMHELEQVLNRLPRPLKRVEDHD